MIILYSILHLLVDGICAFAMFGRFLPQGNAAIDLILYNFCAFALQMPFGVLLDYLETKTDAASGFKTYSYFAAASGVLLTILGSVTHPVLLGIGNALFHIGGGVDSIHEDNARNRNGRGLGVFVAPGALGLYLGTLAAKNELGSDILRLPYILMILICAAVMIQHKNYMKKTEPPAICSTPNTYCQSSDSTMQIDAANGICISAAHGSEKRTDREKLYLLICCLSVVVLRSYIGMTVTFSWKTTFLGGLLAVLAVVSGKMAGGFLAAKYGIGRVAVSSLFMAAIAYIGSSIMPMGIAALILFNMTMPVTLYLLIRQFPQMPGFSFGLLTFGLFLGFLPEYFGLSLMTEGNIIGSAGSILSLFILLAGIYCCQTHSNASGKNTAERRLY